MNVILSLFGKKQNLQLQENEESYLLGVGDDFDNSSGLVPSNVTEIRATSVSTEDNSKSVVLITDDEIKTFFGISVIDNNNGNAEDYKILFTTCITFQKL
jgi:hypothetical protein